MFVHSAIVYKENIDLISIHFVQEKSSINLYKVLIIQGKADD